MANSVYYFIGLNVSEYFDLCTSFCCLSSSFMRISLASALAALFAASLASALGVDNGRNRNTERRKKGSETAADLFGLTWHEPTHL